MINAQPNTPDLEERFLEPKGWRWHSFTRNNREIRFGSVFPADKVPDAVVVCLPGFAEFGEKYFETARKCLDMNLAFWVLDWMGQGHSGRYLNDPQKRHSSTFQDDVDDLHYFFVEYIKHACVHPDVGRIPAAMLAHSMGANIGLQYLHQHPDVFECAAFSAPMLGFKAVKNIPKPLLSLASVFMALCAGTQFIKNGRAWEPSMRTYDGPEALSCDPDRVKVHGSWLDADHSLQVGSPTYGWIYHALKACSRVNKKAFLAKIETPGLMALAGEEHIVDNAKIRLASQRLKNCELLNFPEARHEIWMEKDEVRDVFFEKFYALVKENIIDRPETLKPF